MNALIKTQLFDDATPAGSFMQLGVRTYYIHVYWLSWQTSRAHGLLCLYAQPWRKRLHVSD